MIIYRMTDRIPIKIGGVTFQVAPLSHYQKATLLEFRKTLKGVELIDSFKLTEKVMACSIKGVDGLTLRDGSPYELKWDDSGELTTDCVAELMQVDGFEKMIQVVQKFAFDSITDPKLEGVEIDFGAVPLKKT